MTQQQRPKLCVVARLGRIAVTLVRYFPGGACRTTVRARMTEDLRAAVCAAIAAEDYQAAVDAVCQAAKG